MQRVLTLMLLAVSVSCENSDPELKVVDVEKFTIQMPATWNASQSQGYDSFVGEIVIGSEQSVTFDLGWYSSKLNMDPTTHDIDFTTIDGKTANW